MAPTARSAALVIRAKESAGKRFVIFTGRALTLRCPRCGGRGILQYWSWPAVPWRVVELGGVAVMIAIPIAFYPFSRTLWLAWDLCFRPAEEGDLAT